MGRSPAIRSRARWRYSGRETCRSIVGRADGKQWTSRGRGNGHHRRSRATCNWRLSDAPAAWLLPTTTTGEPRRLKIFTFSAAGSPSPIGWGATRMAAPSSIQTLAGSSAKRLPKEMRSPVRSSFIRTRARSRGTLRCVPGRANGCPSGPNVDCPLPIRQRVHREELVRIVLVELLADPSGDDLDEFAFKLLHRLVLGRDAAVGRILNLAQVALPQQFAAGLHVVHRGRHVGPALGEGRA